MAEEIVYGFQKTAILPPQMVMGGILDYTILTILVSIQIGIATLSILTPMMFHEMVWIVS